jgi:hypothetical protein
VHVAMLHEKEGVETNVTYYGGQSPLKVLARATSVSVHESHDANQIFDAYDIRQLNKEID